MKSFLQGKKSLDLAALRPPAMPAQAMASAGPGLNINVPGHAHGAASASVEVVKQGDKVVRLIVTCVCGERVEVECLYPAGG
jgi:hypothetical protein